MLSSVGCDNEGNTNLKNLERIELGMDKKHVVTIMGLPKDTTFNLNLPVVESYYYHPPFLNSDGIYIGFDKNDKVYMIKKDKGDIIIRKNN